MEHYSCFMKKCIALIFLAGLVLAISGCTIPGQSSPTPTATAQPVVTATPAATATVEATAAATSVVSATAAPTTTAIPTAAAGAGNETDSEVAKYKGTWQTTYGMMTFTVSGKHASGVYEWKNGTIEATLSDDGKTMEGMWYEEPTRLPPDDAGRFIFTLSDDGNKISGKWWYGEDGEGGDWDGTRVSGNGTSFQ
jgi:hypothetical protein